MERSESNSNLFLRLSLFTASFLKGKKNRHFSLKMHQTVIQKLMCQI